MPDLWSFLLLVVGFLPGANCRFLAVSRRESNSGSSPDSFSFETNAYAVANGDTSDTNADDDDDDVDDADAREPLDRSSLDKNHGLTDGKQDWEKADEKVQDNSDSDRQQDFEKADAKAVVANGGKDKDDDTHEEGDDDDSKDDKDDGDDANDDSQDDKHEGGDAKESSQGALVSHLQTEQRPGEEEILAPATPVYSPVRGDQAQYGMYDFTHIGDGTDVSVLSAEQARHEDQKFVVMQHDHHPIAVEEASVNDDEPDDGGGASANNDDARAHVRSHFAVGGEDEPEWG